jgi:hypothetical protein
MTRPPADYAIHPYRGLHTMFVNSEASNIEFAGDLAQPIRERRALGEAL